MTMKATRKQHLLACALVCALTVATGIASSANLAGSVQGAAKSIAGATVTLYAAGTGAPTQLAQATTDDRGAFKLTSDKAPADSVLYVIARGGTPKAAADNGPNDAIALLAMLGGTPPKRVVVNEFSTIASVWTSAQFLKSEALSGKKLGLRIAAGNVPNLADLATGGLGPVIQDPFNSSQTATLATFSTLGDLLAGCITRVQGDACNKLFAAASPPAGVAPTNTLTAAQKAADDSWPTAGMHDRRLQGSLISVTTPMAVTHGVQCARHGMCTTLAAHRCVMLAGIGHL